MGNMTCGWSAKATEAKTSPVPLLFAILADKPMRQNAEQRRQNHPHSEKGYDAAGGEFVQVFGVIQQFWNEKRGLI